MVELPSSDPTDRKRPPKWEERFVIKRIEEEDIEISLAERNALVNALNANKRFAQLGKHTIMLNSIKSIDPLYGDLNIPPRPKPTYSYKEIRPGTMKETITNQAELDEWDALFGEVDKKLLLPDEVL